MSLRALLYSYAPLTDLLSLISAGFIQTFVYVHHSQGLPGYPGRSPVSTCVVRLGSIPQPS